MKRRTMRIPVTETVYVDSASLYFSTKKQTAQQILHPVVKGNIVVKEDHNRKPLADETITPDSTSGNFGVTE